MYKKIIFILIVSFILFYLYQKLITQKTKLQIGDSIPDFSLKDQNGNLFTVKDYVGKNNLIIYFYPKDDTPGCTKEACKFRDEFQDFTDLKAKVIGISSDSVESHKKFADKYNLPFTLLADSSQKVRKLFGVPNFSGIIPGRVTYVIDKNGKIVFIFNSMQQAEKHIDKAKSILKEL
jgi:peroxiredoxin Q/BCP